MFMAVHLLNTFVLIGWLTLTAWWVSGGDPISLRAPAARVAAFAIATTGLLLVGVSGAVAALGNTLYPDGSLAEGLAADLSAASHFLIRLRILHPVFAVLTAMGLIFGASRMAGRADGGARKFARRVALLSGVQLGLGALNVILLAPVWLQLTHLLVADALWIAFVLLGARTFAVPAATVRVAHHNPGAALVSPGSRPSSM
jgi:heme A synthase